MTTQRVGIFGGTFDPVHQGHLILAEQCRDQTPLDEVWFVPAARPPGKEARQVTPFERRVEMLQLATAGHRAFRVDRIEMDRPGPSYTADTLAELRQRHPDTEFFLLVGADLLPELPNWRDPQRVVELAALLAVNRPGTPLWPVERLAEALHLADASQLRLRVIDVPPIDIASRELRKRVAAGRSIRYLVPRAVEVYIAEKRLYREPPDAGPGASQGPVEQ